MGFLDRFKGSSTVTIEQLEDDLDRTQLQSQIAGGQAEIAERQAIVRELQAKYGKGWKGILGLKGMPSLPSLRSVLHGVGNPKLAQAANNEINGGTTGGIRKQMMLGGEKLRQPSSGTKLMNVTSGDKLKDVISGDKLKDATAETKLRKL